jgi:hypothetical protein
MLKRIFGHKLKNGITKANGNPTVESKTGRTRLTIEDVRRYSISLASKRGYPKDSLDMIAHRTCFLERRGLPGFTALICEFTSHLNETLEQRSHIERQGERKGGHCPFMAAIHLNEHLEILTSCDPYNDKIVVAPSNPMLLIPKVASFVGPLGRLACMHWYVGDEKLGMTVIDGFRIGHKGDLFAPVKADAIGFSLFPEGDHTPPPLQAGTFEYTEISDEWLERLHLFLDS